MNKFDIEAAQSLVDGVPGRSITPYERNMAEALKAAIRMAKAVIVNADDWRAEHELAEICDNIIERDPAPMTRRPMETAPKDGCPILGVAYVRNCQVSWVIWWNDRLSNWVSIGNVLRSPEGWVPLPEVK